MEQMNIGKQERNRLDGVLSKARVAELEVGVKHPEQQRWTIVDGRLVENHATQKSILAVSSVRGDALLMIVLY